MAGRALRKPYYTWDDYQTWDDARRWEIIAGDVYDMTPAPGLSHQSVSTRLSSVLDRFFRGKSCRVFSAPVDVKLSNDDIVQPDIVVECDASHLKGSHIDGAPTLVVEILSPSTQAHDRMRKMPLYAKSGVREVWLVSTDVRLVEIYVLNGHAYLLKGTHSIGTSLRSQAFPDLRINLTSVFEYLPDAGDSSSMVREASPPYKTKPLIKHTPARKK
jgi:Uma2 family endonuclease